MRAVELLNPSSSEPEPRYILPTLSFPKWDDMALHVGMPYLLSGLIAALQPKVVVEAGTYRGHGTLAIAHTLHTIRNGHLWTADPFDHGVADLLQQAGLAERATYVKDSYENLLGKQFQSRNIDFAFIDASGSTEDGVMRMRHLLMTLDRLAMGGVIVMDDIAATDWPFVNVIRSLSQLYFPGMRGVAIYQKRTELT